MRYRPVKINEDDVPPSKHALFIRGIDVDISREKIQKHFNDEIGPCSIVFYKPGRDSACVAVRFEARDDAVECFKHYENKKVLNCNVEITWYKDIRSYAEKLERQYSDHKSYDRRTSSRHNYSRGESSKSSRRHSRSRSRSRSKDRAVSISSADESPKRKKHRRRRSSSSSYHDRHRSSSKSSSTYSHYSPKAKNGRGPHTPKQTPPQQTPPHLTPTHQASAAELNGEYEKTVDGIAGAHETTAIDVIMSPMQGTDDRSNGQTNNAESREKTAMSALDEANIRALDAQAYLHKQQAQLAHYQALQVKLQMERDFGVKL